MSANPPKDRITPSIDETRKRIDEIDAQIARLFEERLDLMEDVRAYKKAHGLPVLDTRREEEVLARSAERVKNPAYVELYRSLQESIMTLGKMRQVELERAEQAAGERT